MRIEDKKKWCEKATQTHVQLVLKEKMANEAIVKVKETLARFEAEAEDYTNRIAKANL